jgi:tetratricopeptide (TPR) repeat protein
VLNTLAGVAILEEDPARAEALLAESQMLAQGAPSDSFRIAWRLNHLGQAAQLRGAYDRAAQLHLESLGSFKAGIDHAEALPHAYHDLGQAMLGLGRLDDAASWFAQGLAAGKVQNHQATIAWNLAGLASVMAMRGQPDQSARLSGAAGALRMSIGCRSAPAARLLYERSIATARAQLGEGGFAAAWAAGGALTLEQAIAYALGENAEAHSSHMA